MPSVTIHDIYVRTGGDTSKRLKVLTESPGRRYYLYVFMIPDDQYEIVPLVRKEVRLRRDMLKVVSRRPLRRQKDLKRIPPAVKMAVRRYKGRPYELRAYYTRRS